ncbi:ATP-binding protein [Sediminibacterium sp.]|uniref:HAMP domain-containing sensor histidine kinase n=1 Tax=Sediminibacterium sp. TaxID=1917865 RepID=UPI003F721F9F
MNLKLRFALLFTSFVAAILIIACASIYFLYATYREDDYYNRIQSEGNDLYGIYVNLQSKSSVVKQDDILRIHRIALVRERLVLLDSSGSLIFSLGENSSVDLPVINYSQVRKAGIIRLTDKNDHQIVISYKPNEKQFLITAAYDQIGLKKLKTMRFILAGVFGASLLLTAVMSFLFVGQAIKPIVELSNQMKRTNELNLSERITVKPAKDEINAIAQNFNAMLERLKNAFEFRKSYVHQTSHELRTPLAVMLSQTEAALNSNYDAAGYKKVLMSLKEDQQHLIELTNSLLLISQNEQIEFMDEWPYLRIDELLFDTVAYFNRNFPDVKTAITFDTMPLDDAELLVKGNESLLKAAFINLLKNAYLYSDDKTIIITLNTNKQEIVIKFENRGEQIGVEDREKIFFPFFRGSNVQKKKGFGLGLPIVNRIVQIHKGRLSYQALDNDKNLILLQLPVKG